MFDYNKRLMLLSVIPLSSGHCNFVSLSYRISSQSNFFVWGKYKARGQISATFQVNSYDGLPLSSSSIFVVTY
jgi:hypothetical protein